MTREMKDSGIEWIGQIPNCWTVSRYKYCSDLYTGNSIKDSEKDRYEEKENAIPYISSKDINLNSFDANYENGMYVKENDISFKKASKGSTLICIEGGSAGKKKTFLTKDVAFVNKLCCYAAKYNLENKFLYYSLCNPAFEMEFASNITGLIGGVSVSTLKEFNIVLPNKKEQLKISNFLDSKCSQIDSILTSLQDQIDTLEQYKKSVITEAVTKGLNPDVEMKDSGIPWVGKVPSQWNIHPIFVYYYEGKNKNNACKENNLLSLSYGKIIRKDINTNEGLLPASFSTYNVVSKNDIIIRPTDLQNDKRSLRTGLVTETGIITSAYIDLKPYPFVNSKYYHYLLHSYDLMKVFYNMGNGVRQGLNFTEFSRLLVLEPSKSEQDQIVDFLNSQCSQIDSIISQKKEQMETLREYKKSLIYEYVTGKKEVPNA